DHLVGLESVADRKLCGLVPFCWSRPGRCRRRLHGRILEAQLSPSHSALARAVLAAENSCQRFPGVSGGWSQMGQYRNVDSVHGRFLANGSTAANLLACAGIVSRRTSLRRRCATEISLWWARQVF